MTIGGGGGKTRVGRAGKYLGGTGVLMAAMVVVEVVAVAEVVRKMASTTIESSMG